ncbi:SpoIVB peptidase [Pelotomaculum propionicicum]|uniref:SpoIVB peptidase n=1 Tax=Pelotomaculum propionicicum TaxID=258475 RepID=UPI003B7BEDCB
MRGRLRGLLCCILVLVSGFLSYQAQGIMQLPDKQSVVVGEPLKIEFPAPLQKSLKSQVYGNDNLSSEYKDFDSDPTSFPAATEPGQYQVRLSLFGLIPVRDVLVSVVPQVKVVPGGQSIGVLIRSQGVTVVGHSAVLDEYGNHVNPSGDLKEGDVILKVDGVSLRSDGQFRDAVAKAGASGKPLTMEVERNGQTFVTSINPVYCKDTLRFRVGLLIRDSTAGIGTLTFYEPESMVYGALGHMVTDLGSTSPIEISDGEIIDADVQSIHRGRRGQPGEKVGILIGDKKVNGTITKNSRLGIFGALKKIMAKEAYNEPIPVAMTDQIHEGQAEILTVIEDDKVEKFEIEIIKINPLARHDGKAMVIKITDQRLLDKTGGIVQGMSGSPIIQDNRLIGAVTHVFVNDPTKGYGIPAEWMVEESGLQNKNGRTAEQPAA